MFIPRGISLASILLLSSRALATIPAAFTAGFNPSTIELVADYSGSVGEIKDGETLTAADTATVPKFALGDSSAISKSSKYIILMIDPDSPELDDDTSVQVLHYLKADFSVTEATSLGSTATPAMPYAGPGASVGTGPHRYIFLLYDQPAGFANVGVPSATDRTFNVKTWREANGLKAAVAGVHFVATPGGGAAVISSTAAAAESATGVVSTSMGHAVTTPPCTTSTVMAHPTTAPAVGITTDTALPPSPTTIEIIASPPSAVTTHKVIVGGPNKLTYQPAWVEAAVGDIVEFDFMEKNHTVTQSTFDTPCVFNSAGVKSGFRPNAENIPGKEIFTFTVSDEKPKWFFCAQGKHCQAGMVFAVNPGTKFPEFVAKATGAVAGPSSSAAPLYPTSTTLIPSGTGALPTAIVTGNSTAPGATGVPVFEGAASGRAAASWVLAGVAGLVAFAL